MVQFDWQVCFQEVEQQKVRMALLVAKAQLEALAVAPYAPLFQEPLSWFVPVLAFVGGLHPGVPMVRKLAVTEGEEA